VNLDFLYTAVSWVLLRWHSLFNFFGLAQTGGLNWALSIIFLVVTARLLLFRLFVKQVHYQRHMQEMQPQIQELRKKFKDDRAELNRQMMKLQQEQGFNPLSGCLPMLVQLPVFYGLFHTLRHIANSASLCSKVATHPQLHPHVLNIYSFTQNQTCDAANAKLFGGAPLAGSLRDSASVIHQLGGQLDTTRTVTLVLVLVSAAATFFTQLFVASRATTTPTGTAATVQKLMKVFIPISVLVSGVLFPLGVLLYWFTSNVWTMLQQLYINKYHPPTITVAPETGVLGKSLAPKPGARPSRDARGRTTLTKASDAPADGVAVDGSDDSAGTPPPRAPRPGQRPQRQSGSRPPGKRPSQAKKRR
jgi:YidC/Oxa1 family membrane protein insertase